MSGKHGFQDEKLNGDLSSPSKIQKMEKDEPQTHEERLSRVKDFFNKGGGMPPMIRPKPKPLKKPTPMETSTSKENKSPEPESPLSPDRPEDPGPIILNTESLVQLSQVVEFDLDAVVRQQQLLDTTAQKHKAYLSQGKGLQSRRLPSNLADKVPEDYTARRRAQTYASSTPSTGPVRAVHPGSPAISEETDSGSVMTEEERKQKILARAGVQQSNPLAALGSILRRGGSGRGSFNKGSKSPKKSLPESPRTTPKPKKRTSLDTPDSPYRLGSEPPKSPKGFLRGLRRSSSKSKKRNNGVNESSEDLTSETSSVLSLPAHTSVRDEPMETGASSVGNVSPAKSAVVSMNGDMHSTDQGPSSSSPVASPKAQDLSVTSAGAGKGLSPSFTSPVHNNRDSACFKESSIESLFGSNSNLFDTSELEALLGKEKREKTPEKVLDETEKSRDTPSTKYGGRAKTPDSTLLESKKAVGASVSAAHLQRPVRPSSASSTSSSNLKARLKMYEASYKAASKDMDTKDKEDEKEPDKPILASTPKADDATKKKSSLLFEDDGEDDLFSGSKKDDKPAEKMDVDKKKASLFDDELFQDEQKQKEPSKPAPKVAPKIAPKVAPKVAPKAALKTTRKESLESPKREAASSPTTTESPKRERMTSPPRVDSPKKEKSPPRSVTPKKEKSSPSPVSVEEDTKTSKLSKDRERSLSPVVATSPQPAKEVESKEEKMEVETVPEVRAKKSSDVFGVPLDDEKAQDEDKKKVTKSKGLFEEDESTSLFSSRKRDKPSAEESKPSENSDKLVKDEAASLVDEKKTKKSDALLDDGGESSLLSSKRDTKLEEEEKPKTGERRSRRSRLRFDDTPIPVFSARKRREREQKDEDKTDPLSASDDKTSAKSLDKETSKKPVASSSLFDDIDEQEDVKLLAGRDFGKKKTDEDKDTRTERKLSGGKQEEPTDAVTDKTRLEKESDEREKVKRVSQEEKSKLFEDIEDDKKESKSEDKPPSTPELTVSSPTSPLPPKEEKDKKEEELEEKTKSEAGGRPSSGRDRTSPRSTRSKAETSGDTRPSGRSRGATTSSVTDRKTKTGGKKEADDGAKPAWMLEIQKRRETKKEEKSTSTSTASRRREAGSTAAKDSPKDGPMPEWQKRALERKKKAEAEKASSRSSRLDKSSPRAGQRSPTSSAARSPISGRRSTEASSNETVGRRSPRTRQTAEERSRDRAGLSKSVEVTSSRVRSGRLEKSEEKVDKEDKDKVDTSEPTSPEKPEKSNVEITITKTSSEEIDGSTSEPVKSVSPEPTDEGKAGESKADVRASDGEDSVFSESVKVEKKDEKKESKLSESADSAKESATEEKEPSKGVEDVDSGKKSVGEETDDKESVASDVKSSRTASPLPEKSPSRSSSRQSNASSTEEPTRSFRSHTISSTRSPTPPGSGGAYSGLPKGAQDSGVPEWKRKLLEKKKAGGKETTSTSRPKTVAKEPEVPAWKKELMAKKASKPEEKSGSTSRSGRVTRDRSATVNPSSSSTSRSSPRSAGRRHKEPETPDFMKEFQRKKKTT